MNEEIRQLERTVEQQMHLLEGLSTPAPRSECTRRVKAAVTQEAAILRRQARVLRVARHALAAAAAILLVIGLYRPLESSLSPVPAGDPAELLVLWGDVVDDSGQAVTALFSESWLPGQGEAPGDVERDIEDLFDSLDQSFMIGT